MKKKRVEWKVWVYRNNYREKQGEYPRVMLRGNMDMDGLAAEVARRAGTYSVETVRAIASLLERTAEELLVEGYSVTGRLGTLTPAVTGMWNPDRTSPSARAQNRAVARYAMGGALKEAFADPLFHEEARAAAVPVIGEARNADAEAEGRTAWRTGDLVEVRGKLLLMTDAYYDTPNLDGVMAGFGLARVDGLVVEGDPDHSLYGYSYYLLPDYAQPSVSTALDGITSSVPVLVQMAQGIRITPTDGVTAEPLLTTSGSAYSKVAGYEMTTTEREEGDLDGPFDLAVYAQAEDTGAEVIWIGSSNMDNEANYPSVPGNCDFLVGCAASLTGQSSDILIDSKALEADLLTIPAGVVAPLGLTFLLVIPAGLLIAGAVVTIRRRRR